MSTIRKLSKELARKAEIELNEAQDRLQDDLDNLKQWLKKQAHLNVRTDDQWLLSFLRGCKHSVEQARTRIDTLYFFRSRKLEYFTDRDVLLPEVQDVLSSGVLVCLPQTKEPSGPRIVILRLGRCDPSKISLASGIKALLMVLEFLLMEDDNFVVGGQQVIVDLKNVSYQYVTQLTPHLIQTCVLGFRYSYPVRPQGVHVLNTSAIWESIYSLGKRFAPAKLLNRVRFYKENELEDMHNVIPLELLPKEYGGGGDSVDALTVDLKTSMERYRDWFLEEASYFYDVTKRGELPSDFSDLYGLEGTFRKLNID